MLTGVAALQILGPVRRTAVLAAPAAPALAQPEWDGRIAGPDPALLEPSRALPAAGLPRIGADGRLPRVAYRRPAAPPGTRPRIALLLAGVGLAAADSRAAIDRLPGVVSLAFSAYTPNPEALAEAARSRGHEILASLPMEANGYPWIDAGPRSLLTGNPPAANRENLEWAMSRLQGYVGVTGASDGLRGERFAEQGSSFSLVLDEAARRGLLYVDPRPGAPAPPGTGRTVDVVIDDPATRADIEAKLIALERLARDHGSALGLAGPLRPTTVERIAAWTQDVEKRGYELVPVSALATEPVQ
jgi:polysaccharide deacetylase 2 family uncharacterized protein YibQ